MKKISVILISALIIFSLPVYGESKDESVYVVLNESGEVTSTTVITYLNYDEATDVIEDINPGVPVVNLTDQSVSVDTDEVITFNLEKPVTTFNYRTESSGALPFDYEFKYFFEGTELEGHELAGVNGFVEIIALVTPSSESLESYESLYMSQMTVTLDLESVNQVVADGASKVTSGNALKLSYINMPNTSGEYHMSFIAEDFEMESIIIALIPSQISLPEDISEQMNEMTEGFDKIDEGMVELIDGTTILRSGIVEFDDGLKTFSMYMSDLTSSSRTLSANTKLLLKGYSDVASNMVSVSVGSNAIANGLKELVIQGETILNGYNELGIGVTSLNTQHQQLSSLAANLLTHSDPQVVALAQGVLYEAEVISLIETNLNTLNDGFELYASGVDQVTSEYTSFDLGITALSDGLNQLEAGNLALDNTLPSFVDGVKKLSESSVEMSEQVSEIPDNISLLVDGQNELKEGLIEASDQMTEAIDGFESEDMVIHSFVNGETQVIDSLQFFIKTPAIEKVIVEEVIVEEVEETSFFKKLINLFK